MTVASPKITDTFEAEQATMLNKKGQIQLTDYREALSNYFAKVTGVTLAFLFGSQARQEASLLSDVDIAVLVDNSLTSAQRFDLRLRMIGELTDLLRSNDVDMTILNDASLPLQYRVLRDGVLLYCRNEDIRVQFTAKTVVTYLDFEPLLRRHEEAVLEKARRGELLSGYNADQRTLEHYRAIRERLKNASKTDT
jgi:predicted nucleotidyltransferase